MMLGSSPEHFVRPPWVRHTVGGHSEWDVVPLPLLELQLPTWNARVAFRVTPAALALLFLAGATRTPSSEWTEN